MTRSGPFYSQRASSALAGLLLATGFAEVHAQSAAPITGTYMCVDAKGNALTSDRPIPACFDREQRVLGPTGTLKARIPPQLTPEQRAAQEERQRAEAAARMQANEEKRRERALLMRYPSQAAHDKERAEAIARLTAVTQIAYKRIEELKADKGKLDAEMEFYRKDPAKAPAPLRAQVQEIARGVEEQKRFIAAQDVEAQRIHARFDEELARLKLLWQAQAPASR